MKRNDELSREIARIMKRLYKRGLTTSTGGNISVRAGIDRFLITPSGKDKSALKVGDICLFDSSGKALTKNLRLSMETPMHLAIYTIRSDVHAIVHAHPPFATSYAVCSKIPNTGISGEMRALLGRVAMARYACMGSNELAERAAKAAENAQVILLENHGAVALGRNLTEAFERMEVLELASKIGFIAGLLGGARELSDRELEDIDRTFQALS